MTTDIPVAKGYPIIGSLLDLQDEVPLHAVERITDIYGPLVKINALGRQMIVCSGYELFDELCDETRFYKQLSGALADKQTGARPQGLFTAKTEKLDDWRQAHSILVPAFGPLAIEEMFDAEMHDIVSQLLLKWARQGPNHSILASDDFSRLTLDTLALCAMDYRFNSFYSDELHPFIKSMNGILTERSEANQLTGIMKKLIPSYREQLRKDQELQQKIPLELVEYRRSHPTEKKDLLNAMIYGKDPRTGQTMRNELIAANMQTFLIAGHETTSGLLSFAFMLMLKNPATYFKAQKEVDDVVGKEKITAKHLRDLHYINGLLRETLRLYPTAPGFSRAVRPENKEEKVTIGGGKYEIPRDTGIMCFLSKIQRDPKIWGDDAEEFKPERMMDGEFEKIPKNAWKPFGTGMRACIGRAFAWQEALLAVALIMQNFDVQLEDPNYEVRLVQSLTIKPKDMYMRATLRPGISATALQQRLNNSSSGDSVALKQSSGAGTTAADKAGEGAGAGVTILYGSNTGTSQVLAQRLASQATQRGITAKVNDLDSAIDRLPTKQPLVIITASYEGQPPDNAARFIAWLESLDQGNSLKGVKYAVFGCGHSDWVSTYQRIPKLVDDLFSQHGGQRLAERGLADVSDGDTYGAFDGWTEKTLWPALSSVTEASAQTVTLAGPAIPTIEMEVSQSERASYLQQNVQWAKVTGAKCLIKDGQGEKRQVEFQLPSNTTYTTGDYLAVLPLNPEENVRKVMKRFELPWDGVVNISKSGSTTLPTGQPISIFDLLRGYVEISLPANRMDVEFLAFAARDDADKSKLRALASEEAYKTEIADKRVTILDLLEWHPSAAISFAQFLALLPPLRPRYYSISSSPLAHPTHCSLTYSVIDAPSWSSSPDGGAARFLGVAGTYLRGLQPGDQALVAVRSTNKFFRLPVDPETTPVVMMCAGSGLAPFRGFVEERAVQIREGGRKLAPALLFVGCRRPEDARAMYGDELEAWAQLGAVDVRYAYSRDPDASAGCKYVQDRLLRDRDDVLRMWAEGARFYTCGSAALAKGLGAAASQLVAEGAKRDGIEVTEEQITEFKHRMRNERFVSDIFD
ncbi:fatty acid hydroxylase [Xylariales sp. PMI_506]|nr:fatty acid hydroxylase [Xylariales sp. PMI_506]